MDTKIRLFDILWQTKGAGPSPDDNRRTELYFGGCRRALSGHPCEGCFNQILWDGSCCKERTVGDVIRVLETADIPKYITIVGGEPTDQPEALVALGKELKKRHYHVLLFTWRSIEWLIENDIPLDLFDIIISGPYIAKDRIYNSELDDGVHNAIGSGNQLIYFSETKMFHYASELEGIVMTKDKTEILLKEMRENES